MGNNNSSQPNIPTPLNLGFDPRIIPYKPKPEVNAFAADEDDKRISVAIERHSAAIYELQVIMQQLGSPVQFPISLPYKYAEAEPVITEQLVLINAHGREHDTVAKSLPREEMACETVDFDEGDWVKNDVGANAKEVCDIVGQSLERLAQLMYLKMGKDRKVLIFEETDFNDQIGEVVSGHWVLYNVSIKKNSFCKFVISLVRIQEIKKNSKVIMKDLILRDVAVGITRAGGVWIIPTQDIGDAVNAAMRRAHNGDRHSRGCNK